MTSRKRTVGRRLSTPTAETEGTPDSAGVNVGRASESHIERHKTRRLQELHSTTHSSSSSATANHPIRVVEGAKPTERIPSKRATPVSHDQHAPSVHSRESYTDELKESASNVFTAATAFLKTLFAWVTGFNKTVSLPEIDYTRYPFIDAGTGEDGEDTVFQSTATLYVHSAERWYSAGCGGIRINVDNNRQARIIMRRQGTLCLLLNCRLYPKMTVLPMGHDAVAFTCPNPEIQDSTDATSKSSFGVFALRFKMEPSASVEDFKAAIERHRG